MEPSPSNGFGSNTYWNLPPQRRARSQTSNRPSRSLSPTNRDQNARIGFASFIKAAGNTRPPSLSPTDAQPPTATTTARGAVNVKVDPSLNSQRLSGVQRDPRADTSSHTYMQDMLASFDSKDDLAMVKLMKSKLPQFSEMKTTGKWLPLN